LLAMRATSPNVPLHELRASARFQSTLERMQVIPPQE